MSATMSAGDGDGPKRRPVYTPDWEKLASDSERRARQRRLTAFIAAVFGLCVALIATFLIPDVLVAKESKAGVEKLETRVEPVDLTPFAWIGAVLFACLVVALIFFLITRRQYMKNENQGFAAALQAREEYHRQALEKLRKTTELATLMELNQDQIGEYHRIVTAQADKAFRSSRTAMGVGLFLLVCAAFGGVYVPLEEIRWFIAALAAFSTLLSGYVSRTYLALYRDSIAQLNRYFDQPVLNSYYLTAERLAHGLNDEYVTEVRRQIINEVLATSARMGAKEPDPGPDPVLTGGKPKKKSPKKRVPKQATPSANGQRA
jgi:ABC-type multidrug transport system fused ATPase/permease subunit